MESAGGITGGYNYLLIYQPYAIHVPSMCHPCANHVPTMLKQAILRRITHGWHMVGTWIKQVNTIEAKVNAGLHALKIGRFNSPVFVTSK
jgi:hypothetical protein